MNLISQKCRTYKKGELPLTQAEATALQEGIPAWTLRPGSIEREFLLKDFRQAMAFVNAVAAIANEEDHHPDIAISYNKVKLTLSTHKIGGLSLNDFILAAKIDRASVMTEQRT
jgi:4a-hydroxytetrahydrobiopterin dehydratase